MDSWSVGGQGGVGGWRRWAETHVLSVESKVGDEMKGPRLLELIEGGGEAARALKKVTPTSVAVKDGHLEIFKALDEIAHIGVGHGGAVLPQACRRVKRIDNRIYTASRISG